MHLLPRACFHKSSWERNRRCGSETAEVGIFSRCLALFFCSLRGVSSLVLLSPQTRHLAWINANVFKACGNPSNLGSDDFPQVVADVRIHSRRLPVPEEPRGQRSSVLNIWPSPTIYQRQPCVHVRVCGLFSLAAMYAFIIILLWFLAILATDP